ncbi:hypothetical protein Fmac_031171 [Flemingia macrophylla]|uniref:Uncharacterized protein n=1 Tax=Flemingia macrophylla TaxID=520843 RepID=A0ABD1L197_9FABA
MVVLERTEWKKNNTSFFDLKQHRRRKNKVKYTLMHSIPYHSQYILRVEESCSLVCYGGFVAIDVPPQQGSCTSKKLAPEPLPNQKQVLLSKSSQSS